MQYVLGVTGIAIGAAVAGFTAFVQITRHIGVTQKDPSATVADAIVVHTYCPKRSHIPRRGQLVVESACRLACDINVPLILAVGHTVPRESRTEAEIYRDYIKQHLPTCLGRVILGQNPEAQDTYQETKEAVRLLTLRGYKSLFVVGLQPHLPRITKHWAKLGGQLKITYVAVEGPKRYYIWEFLMFVSEWFIPPQSRRRRFVLNLVGRKK
ncbi:MAG: hypothetical protein A3C12_01320 [Candidatus Sungbacteria bacterium RIFCSPHIGHO2_02_FULL_49_20]|uniref:DUF218 domain-containing protein n=1 Tax=Candidatus Sungbacteria bacterium RIFCSPHIGHO2_02_FULL_49_20 TaxID=1802272 RepID=A0A1G2KMW8_9BACT|nr:MAG: hypothetical protein A3C12_01320 [Candidatus Sungbacteria bacterium RIFCSPHIGHO2_02_FULL_49_20]